MTGLRSPGFGTPEEFEKLLLARLGLPPTASPEEIDDAHESVVGYLASAPRAIQAWARVQASVADEAYALLSDPVAFERSRALVERASRPASAPGGPATPPARRDTSPEPSGRPSPPAGKQSARTRNAAAAAEPAELSADELAELVAAVTPSAHRDSVGGAGRRAAGPSKPSAPRASRSLPTRRIGIVAVALVAAAAIAVGGYNLGGGGGTPARASGSGSGAEAAAATPSLDQAAVVALMEKIQANPNDTEALYGLGDAFFRAGDFKASADWLEKLVKIDPTSVRALLALGAAQFNGGDPDTAEATWKQALALDPANVDVHYNLGFLYLYAEPPDMEGVRREWGEVIRLAPDSKEAQTVKTHFEAFASPAPGSLAPSGSPPPSSASPGPGAPPASPSPAASSAPASGAPAASPAPSASPRPGATPGTTP